MHSFHSGSMMFTTVCSAEPGLAWPLPAQPQPVLTSPLLAGSDVTLTVELWSCGAGQDSSEVRCGEVWPAVNIFTGQLCGHWSLTTTDY